MLLKPRFDRQVPTCAFTVYQAMLKDPLVQEMMAAVMGGGAEKLSKYLGDPVSFAMLQKLAKAIERANPK